MKRAQATSWYSNRARSLSRAARAQATSWYSDLRADPPGERGEKRISSIEAIYHGLYRASASALSRTAPTALNRPSLFWTPHFL